MNALGTGTLRRPASLAWMLVFTLILVLLPITPVSAQATQSRPEKQPTVALEVNEFDMMAATMNVSNVRNHLFLTPAAAAIGMPRDLPLLNPPPSGVLLPASSIPSPPPPAFYPADVVPLSANARFLQVTKSHDIYINCSNQSCWGSPETFLSDLGLSAFIHVADQYVGLTAPGRYTLGTNFTANVALFAGGTGVPTLGERDILSLVHAAALQTGAGYGNIYHVFLPKGVDHCMDEGPCYSPDNPSTFTFCAYHGTATFADVGNTYYSVEPFQAVKGCQVPSGTPNGPLADSTNSTLSHELFEAISDPDLNTGWRAEFSGAVFGDEIGDLCGGVVAPVTLNGRPYAIQLEYSNTFHACASTP